MPMMDGSPGSSITSKSVLARNLPLSGSARWQTFRGSTFTGGSAPTLASTWRATSSYGGLKRASRRLAFEPEARIIGIALDAGFETPKSFARAFKREYGQTPSQFRQAPAWKPWGKEYRFPFRERRKTMDVRIVSNSGKRAWRCWNIAVRPERVNNSARIFIKWRKESGLSPKATSRTLGIVYDNPDATPPEAFRWDICGEVTADVPLNPQGVVNKVIPGGRCAVLRHHGAHDRLGESIYPLYREWLPASGEELRISRCSFITSIYCRRHRSMNC